MKREARSLFILLTTMFVMAIAALSISSPKESARYSSVAMLDVGQGDSFLIQTPGNHQILIDAGKDSKVLTALALNMPKGDRHIDVVIATHPDADHIGGLPLVFERYEVGLFLIPQVLSDTESFLSLFEEIEKHDIKAYYLRRGMSINLDGDLSTRLSILFPDRDTSNWETNSASAVSLLEIRNGEQVTRMLLTGDAPSSVEHFLALTDAEDIDVDILKLGHHGSKTSSSEEFLKATSPALALISAGLDNRYGHPSEETMGRLDALGIAYVSTAIHGSVTLYSDGLKWLEKKER